MFRLFTIVLVFVSIRLATCESTNQLFEDFVIKINDLEKKVQDLSNKLSGARVECYDASTRFDLGSDLPIMYLDRQNVNCPQPYFLAQFVLRREGDFNAAKVRYAYRCCKFVL